MTIGRQKGDNISSVNMVRQLPFNRCYRCLYMYIVDVNIKMYLKL